MKPLTFGSAFSGIGGFDCGLDRAGMPCAFQVEKDPHCLTVLAKHWPDVPRFNDVSEFNASTIAVRPDWIVGGFPCQDLSVAGKRAGLAGKRSGLFHEFMRIVSELAPAGVLIENVPGLLSSNGGRDMRVVVDCLAKLGYGWSYRTLDAQYFGVAQRRRRVFIVGHLGGVRRAAEILFESESLPWHPAPRREARKGVAGAITRRIDRGGVNSEGGDGHLVAATLNSGGNNGGFRTEPGEHLIAMEQNQRNEVRDLGNLATSVKAQPGMRNQCFVSHTLRAEGCDASEDGTGRGTPLIAIRTAQGSANGHGLAEEVAHTFDGGNNQAVFKSGVRRLTPVECCRLQGFPDDWLDGLSLSDSANYRMLGNAVCVNVAEWIGRRIIAGGITSD